MAKKENKSGTARRKSTSKGGKANESEQNRAAMWKRLRKAQRANSRYEFLSALISDFDRIGRRATIAGKDPAEVLQSIVDRRSKLIKQVKLNAKLSGPSTAKIVSVPFQSQGGMWSQLPPDFFERFGFDWPPPRLRQQAACVPMSGLLGADKIADFGTTVINWDEKDDTDDGIGEINTILASGTSGFIQFNGQLTADTDPFDDDTITFEHLWEVQYAFPTESYDCRSLVSFQFDILSHLNLSVTCADWSLLEFFVIGFVKSNANDPSPEIVFTSTIDGTVQFIQIPDGFFARRLLFAAGNHFSAVKDSQERFAGNFIVERKTPSQLFLLLGAAVSLKDGTAAINNGSFLIGDSFTPFGGAISYRIVPT